MRENKSFFFLENFIEKKMLKKFIPVNLILLLHVLFIIPVNLNYFKEKINNFCLF
jgi:hypothetical protein